MPTKRNPRDLALSRLMARQHGLVTRQQALELGLPAHVLRTRVDTGLLTTVGRGVYCAAGAPRTWERDALAACLAAGKDAVLSHRSAATAWNLDLPATRTIHVTEPYGRGRGGVAGGVSRHRSRDLRPSDRAVVGALPVTSVARTLVDLAVSLQPGVLARVVDDALCRRIVTPDRLRWVVDRFAMSRRRGVPVLYTVLEPWFVDAKLESVAEAAFVRRLAEAGLPVPVRQHQISDGQGFVARVDFAWPAKTVALEVDGFRWHGGAASHARDSERANRIASLGWTVLRATPTELGRAPGPILAALALHLDTRSGQSSPLDS